jgi:hypothetical protein
MTAVATAYQRHRRHRARHGGEGTWRARRRAAHAHRGRVCRTRRFIEGRSVPVWWLRPGSRFVAEITRQGDGGFVGQMAASIAPFANWGGVDVRFERGDLAGSRWQLVSLYLPIVFMPVHLGGRRPLFLCPRCQRNRARLYLAGGGGAFLCRRCLHLNYECQAESSRWKGSTRSEKILRRLGAGSQNR